MEPIIENLAETIILEEDATLIIEEGLTESGEIEIVITEEEDDGKFSQQVSFLSNKNPVEDPMEASEILQNLQD